MPMLPRRFAVTLLLAALGLPAPAAGQDSCRPEHWTAPSDMALPDGRLLYVEAPFPVAFTGGTLLLGTPTFVWRSGTVFADTGRLAPGVYINPDTLAGALVGSGTRSRVIGRPPGRPRMLAPRAVTRPDGSLDVFWGNTRDTTNAAPLWVSELWHARYDSAGWSTPHLVESRPEIDWNNATPDVGWVGGTVTVAVPVAARPQTHDTTGIAVLRRFRGAWARVVIPTKTEPPGYVALDTAADGSPIVAFTGALELASGRMVWNGAYVSRSTDHGATWERPELLADGGGAHVFGVQSALTANGVLHVVWLQDSTAGGGSRRLMHAESRDGGANWQLQPPFPLSHDVQVLLAAPLDNHVLVVMRGAAGQPLMYGVLGAAGLDSIAELRFSPSASLPRLAPDGPHRVLLVWGVRRPHAYPAFPSVLAPVLEASTFASRCGPAP